MSFAEGLAEADAFPDAFNGTITDSDDTHLTVKYSVYVGLGFIASLACCLPCAAILRHRHLRMKKEYIIVMALTFADFIEAFATTWAGSYRMIGLKNGWAHDAVPIIHCAQFPPVLLWRWSQTSTSFMLLVVSLDRYFAVADPLHYFQYRARYALKIVGVAYGIGALHWLLAWIEPLMNLNETTSALCDAAAIAPVFYSYSKYLTSIVSLSSVVVYGVVVVKLEHRLTLLQECVDARAHNRQAKIQRRLTVTFGLISFCTLIFDAIPCAWGMYLYTHTLFDGDESIYCGSIAPYLFLLNKVDAVCNVFIVLYRHQDIRLALKCLFLNRPISPKFSHMAYLHAMQANKTRRHQQQLLLTRPIISDETKSL